MAFLAASRRGAVAAASLALLATACGTRLPDSAFSAAGTAGGTAGANGSVTGNGSVAGQTSGAGAPKAGAGPDTSGGSAGSAAGASSRTAAAGAKAKNGASDVGVSATEIRLGLVVSKSNPFDPAAFTGPMYGAQAYFDDLNRRGGINGRKVQLLVCDDHGDGQRDQACVHGLIDKSKVFALVGQSVLKYDGASYVQQKGVPDVGSQPIDTAYAQYHHLWGIYGNNYPRNGTVGYGGKLQGGTEVYRYFKQKFPKQPLKAGVVYYNESDSQRYGKSIAAGLRREGYQVVEKQVNFALPDYDSAVIDMKSQGVRYVYDALDSGGNQNLCGSMDANGLSDQIVAKVTTTQGWTSGIDQTYAQSPKCRNKLWATGNTRNFADTKYAGVKAFRAAMTRRHTDGAGQLSEWALEGWAGAQWLTDAMKSCGADLTRDCVEKFMSSGKPYDGHGLLTPRDFHVDKNPPSHTVNCINVARWQDSAQGGHGGWVTQVADMDKNCFDVPLLFYSP